jgi:hypothetical protein
MKQFTFDVVKENPRGMPQFVGALILSARDGSAMRILIPFSHRISHFFVHILRFFHKFLVH